MSATNSPRFTDLDSITVSTPDGATFTVRMLAQPNPSAPVVLILPAMALKAKFYFPLAAALHAGGLSVCTTDLRAQGESTPKLAEAPDFGYRELIETDLPLIVDAVRSAFPHAPLYLFGHSLGGQLALLHTAAAPEEISGVAVIGTGTVFWRAFGPKRWAEALFTIQAIGMVARLRGRWPGGMLIGGAMAGGVMVDWARHSLTSHYRPRGSSRDYDALLRELKTPVLAISLDRDPLGPKSTVDFLCTRVPNADLTRLHLDASSGIEHLDHFEWIKDSVALADLTTPWFRR